MDENARKRKREEDADQDAGEGPDGSGDENLGTEKPKEGLNRGQGSAKKKKKTETPQPQQEKVNDEAGVSGAEARRKQKLEKKAAKRDQKKEQKKEQKKAKATAVNAEEKSEPKTVKKPGNQAPKSNTKIETDSKEDAYRPEAEDDDDRSANEMNIIEGLSLDIPAEEPSSLSSTPKSNSPGLDTSNPHSGSSSISSIVPPIQPSELGKQSPDSKKPKLSQEELKERLQKRLDELRAARKADGFNGKPAKNRQELIEARRQREEQRRAHKKELRSKAKEEEQQRKDEAIAKRFSPSNSGSLLASPRSPAESSPSPTNNFSFGRVAFSDGQQTDPTLTNIEDRKKPRGPQDPGTALKAAQNKQTRLAGLDEEKKANIEEKDMWLNAKKRAHGERIRDDTSLLKKTLKRKQSVKKKSEKEWNERVEGVAKGKEMKQNKREDNLRKRRETKGQKGKKGGSKGKARPGFEGSFKSKSGGKKK